MAYKWPTNALKTCLKWQQLQQCAGRFRWAACLKTERVYNFKGLGSWTWLTANQLDLTKLCHILFLRSSCWAKIVSESWLTKGSMTMTGWPIGWFDLAKQMWIFAYKFLQSLIPSAFIIALKAIHLAVYHYLRVWSLRLTLLQQPLERESDWGHNLNGTILVSLLAHLPLPGVLINQVSLISQ